MRIKKDGTVSVSANSAVPLSFIESFIKSREDFIFKVLNNYNEWEDKKAAEKTFTEGEIYYLLSKPYTLKLVTDKNEGISIDENLITVRVRDIGNKSKIEKIYKAFIKSYSIKVFTEIAEKIYDYFIPHGIKFPQIKTRQMKTLWGSCQTKKVIVTLNSKLIEKDLKSIEYVILHEFGHFVYPNHSKEFYRLVEHFMPDWKDRKKLLNYKKSTQL